MDAVQLELLWSASYQALNIAFGKDDADLIHTKGMCIEDTSLRVKFFESIMKDLQSIAHGGVADTTFGLAQLRHEPVDIIQFIEDPYFMNSKNVIYPKILDAMVEMNNGSYNEAVLTGGIGTGKSTIALYSTAFQLYRLSCYRNPHQVYNLDPSSEIIFIFQSLSKEVAKSVDYSRFVSMVEKSPYFKEEFKLDPAIRSELRFPNRVIVKATHGGESGAIGQNVIGGMIDEINFMAIVENSKANNGEKYNQALALYNSLSRRRKSRFMHQGKIAGVLFLVSSKRYPNQFTDRKTKEAQLEIDRTGKTSIYVYDKRVWDVKPSDAFSGKWFNVYIGTESTKPRILEEGEEVKDKDKDKVIEVPMEYYTDFENDMMNALRDIGGISILSTHPFILDVDKIYTAKREENIPASREYVNFVNSTLTLDFDEWLYPELPHFCHIDLAVTGDSAGIVIGCIPRFVTKTVGDEVEYAPFIHINLVLEVRPPKHGEIVFSKVREILYVIRDNGVNLKWATFDQFQSVDSMQILRQKGFKVGRQSMDITTRPYDYVKSALYENRLSYPPNEKLVMELSTLEKDTKKNKIDHPSYSSKDLSDALAGVVFGLTNRREIWTSFGIPLSSIPHRFKGQTESKDNTK